MLFQLLVMCLASMTLTIQTYYTWCVSGAESDLCQSVNQEVNSLQLWLQQQGPSLAQQPSLNCLLHCKLLN